ncbi:MAG: polyphosphate kinase 2 [Actinomycetia bacterium]|nr:polyphosphate kinase 2 [Actinomycetes bacterium]
MMEDRFAYKDKIKNKLYEQELHDLQVELLKLQRWVKANGEKVVVLFEGRDAAGKGGSIRRFNQYLNPRGARVVALAKPNDTERGQWYFQRYVSHLPTTGELVFFDRSWYNRAGVEVVMGFCSPSEYGEFFRQAPGFERSVVESGIHLFKFWFAVSRAEQLRRFERRKTDPLRQWKFSPVDEASLDKWDDYTRARSVMLIQTDSPNAPWTIINSNEKKRARLEAIRHVVHTIDYEHKDHDVARPPDPRVVQPASGVMVVTHGTPPLAE